MGFPRQEKCSGLPFLSAGDLPNLGITPRSPALQVDSLPTEPPGKPKDTLVSNNNMPMQVNVLINNCDKL